MCIDYCCHAGFEYGEKLWLNLKKCAAIGVFRVVMLVSAKNPHILD